MGLRFNAFNWKDGGQVFIHCIFNVCQTLVGDCLKYSCDLDKRREKREIISLQANFVGAGHVKQG